MKGRNNLLTRVRFAGNLAMRNKQQESPRVVAGVKVFSWRKHVNFVQRLNIGISL